MFQRYLNVAAIPSVTKGELLEIYSEIVGNKLAEACTAACSSSNLLAKIVLNTTVDRKLPKGWWKQRRLDTLAGDLASEGEKWPKRSRRVDLAYALNNAKEKEVDGGDYILLSNYQFMRGFLVEFGYSLDQEVVMYVLRVVRDNLCG